MPTKRERQLELALIEYIERYGFLPKTREFFMEDASDVFEVGKARLEQLRSDKKPS